MVSKTFYLSDCHSRSFEMDLPEYRKIFWPNNATPYKSGENECPQSPLKRKKERERERDIRGRTTLKKRTLFSVVARVASRPREWGDSRRGFLIRLNLRSSWGSFGLPLFKKPMFYLQPPPGFWKSGLGLGKTRDARRRRRRWERKERRPNSQ